MPNTELPEAKQKAHEIAQKIAHCFQHSVASGLFSQISL